MNKENEIDYLIKMLERGDDLDCYYCRDCGTYFFEPDTASKVVFDIHGTPSNWTSPKEVVQHYECCPHCQSERIMQGYFSEFYED